MLCKKRLRTKSIEQACDRSALAACTCFSNNRYRNTGRVYKLPGLSLLRETLCSMYKVLWYLWRQRPRTLSVFWGHDLSDDILHTSGNAFGFQPVTGRYLGIFIRLKTVETSSVMNVSWPSSVSVLNRLKPTGYVMHHQCNIQQFSILPSLYLRVLYLSENKQRLVPLTS